MSIEIEGIKHDRVTDGKVITDTFEINDKATTSVRNELPVGVGGAPIDRIPRNSAFVALLQAGTTTKHVASANRCIRLVTLPLAGGKEGEFHCSRVCTAVGADQLCPEHDKARFQPIQTHPPTNQRVFNSSQIELTEAEKTVVYEKDGQQIIAPLLQGRDIGALRASRNPTYSKTVSVEVSPEVPKLGAQPANSVILSISLVDLDGQDPIGALIGKAIEAMDGLPATSIREMKNVVRIQEKLQKWEWKPLGSGQ